MNPKGPKLSQSHEPVPPPSSSKRLEPEPKSTKAPFSTRDLPPSSKKIGFTPESTRASFSAKDFPPLRGPESLSKAPDNSSTSSSVRTGESGLWDSSLVQTFRLSTDLRQFLATHNIGDPLTNLETINHLKPVIRNLFVPSNLTPYLILLLISTNDSATFIATYKFLSIRTSDLMPLLSHWLKGKNVISKNGSIVYSIIDDPKEISESLSTTLRIPSSHSSIPPVALYTILKNLKNGEVTLHSR